MSHALPWSPAFPSQARILVLVLISCCPKFSCGTSSQTLTTPTKTPPSGLGGLFSSPDPFLPSPLCWYWVLLLCLACQKSNSPSAQIQHPVLALRRAPRASRRLRSALGRLFFFPLLGPFFFWLALGICLSPNRHQLPALYLIIFACLSWRPVHLLLQQQTWFF